MSSLQINPSSDSPNISSSVPLSGLEAQTEVQQTSRTGVTGNIIAGDETLPPLSQDVHEGMGRPVSQMPSLTEITSRRSSISRSEGREEKQVPEKTEPSAEGGRPRSVDEAGSIAAGGVGTDLNDRGPVSGEGRKVIGNDGPAAEGNAKAGAAKEKTPCEKIVDDAVGEIDKKVKSDEGKRRLGKAFRIIGAVLGFLGGAAAVVAGALTVNIPLIIGAGILVGKSLFDVAGAASDGRLSMEALVSKGLQKMGVSENTAAWWGFGIGMAVTLAGIGFSLHAGISGVLSGAKPPRAMLIATTVQTALAKTSGVIGTAVAVSSKVSGADKPAKTLDEEERGKLAKLLEKLDYERNDDSFEELKKLVLLAERYKAASGGRSLLDDIADVYVGDPLLKKSEEKPVHVDGEPLPDLGGIKDELNEPQPDVIRSRPKPAPTTAEVKDIPAQAGRVKTASRIFKCLGGIAAAAGGAFLTMAAVVTDTPMTKQSAFAAGAAAMLKGLVMFAEGVSDKSIGEIAGASHPKLAGFLAALPAIIDAAGGTLMSAVAVSAPPAWAGVRGGTQVQITDKSAASFAGAGIDGKLANTNPRSMVNILADAYGVLSELKQDMAQLDSMRSGTVLE